MKRFLPALVLSLILVQLISIPVAAIPNGFHPVATITTQPAAAITPNSAQLNATITWPAFGMNTPAGSLKPVSYDADLQLATAADSTGYFRYGESSAALTYSTPLQVIPFGATGMTAIAVSLYPCRTYYFQAVLNTYYFSADYQPTPAEYLVALCTTDASRLSAGLGIGLKRLLPDRISHIPQSVVQTGAILSFTTTGCVTNIGSHNASSTGPGGTVGLSNIAVHTAAISSTKVAPGEKVDITAMVTNRGTVNGESKITLYINGAQVESKGVTLASGQSTPVHFYVSENEPGTYNVHVGGVSAGSFTVDALANNDILIYGVIALFTIGIAGTIFLLARKRPV